MFDGQRYRNSGQSKALWVSYPELVSQTTLDTTPMPVPTLSTTPTSSIWLTVFTNTKTSIAFSPYLLRVGESVDLRDPGIRG